MNHSLNSFIFAGLCNKNAFYKALRGKVWYNSGVCQTELRIESFGLENSVTQFCGVIVILYGFY